ncbi:hypothetical protein Phi10:1_gp066 [Cellulophaga phage phi10:1]|uniref:Uncharacterized protein n=1 Tax=Cellulophaga phage phi10:1 TaxID=1327981 RepID=S0A1P1_9CAUD|nr:hypothetical protein Phi10:1_gp066 [Cellulophaga phage phi10:1]AGO48407.1 hypothetical protein Phi10:1_gp066 [Cellulophaga phage phi10:1]
MNKTEAEQLRKEIQETINETINKLNNGDIICDNHQYTLLAVTGDVDDEDYHFITLKKFDDGWKQVNGID